jgi:RNA polymerase sigma factor (TIGR02999 family)
MRLILVDHARRQRSAKRGGGRQRITLTEDSAWSEPGDVLLLGLDDALHELEAMDPRQSKVVELRFFGGLSVDETAAVLGISPATVKRELRMARAWLHAALAE